MRAVDSSLALSKYRFNLFIYTDLHAEFSLKSLLKVYLKSEFREGEGGWICGIKRREQMKIKWEKSWKTSKDQANFTFSSWQCVVTNLANNNNYAVSTFQCDNMGDTIWKCSFYSAECRVPTQHAKHLLFDSCSHIQWRIS